MPVLDHDRPNQDRLDDDHPRAARPHPGTGVLAVRLLDVLVALTLFAAFLQCLWLWDQGQVWWGDALLPLILGAGMLWLLRRRKPTWSRVVTALFTLDASVAAFVGNGLLASLMLLVALLLLVLDFGAIAGAALIAVFAIVQASTMPFFGNTVENTILQTVVMAILLCFGLLFALLVRSSEESRRENERLLGELEATNERLVEANDSLRRTIEVEKELVLADERARSARDLHDGLGQLLTLARMSLDFVERVWAHEPEQALAEVRTARTTTEEALAQMRLWVRALNPPRSVGHDGVAAFDDIAEAFRGTGLIVDVTVAGVERALPQAVSLVSYRFVQEGLTNALKHGNPTRVRLTITYSEDEVRLQLRDDGGPGTSTPAPGFGLRSLRERAQACGGELTLARHPGGFELAVRLPLRTASPVRVQAPA